eukprot:gene2702-3898_t
MSKKDTVLSPRKKKKSSDKIGLLLSPRNSFRISPRSSLDMKSYDVNFSSIFAHTDLAETFYDFLESEHNQEPYLCLEHLEILKKKKTEKEQVEQVNLILDKFIEPGSDYEVNISAETRKKIYSILEKGKYDREISKWPLEQQPYEVFSDLKKTLLSELHSDNFPRFVRSERASMILSKYTTHKDVLVLKISIQFPFSDSDFSVPYINDEELDFMEKLVDDSFDWDLIMSKNGIQTPNVYLSNLNFLPNSKLFESSLSVKVDGIIPLNIESIACTVFGPAIRNVVIEKGLGDIETTKVYTSDEIKNQYPDVKMARERKSFITDIYVKGVFPINTPRRSRIVETIDYNPLKGTISYFHKPYILDEHQDKDVDWKKKMKLPFKNFKTGEKYDTDGYFSVSMHFIYLERITENSTKVVHVIIFNPRGLIENPKGILSIVPKLATKIIEGKVSQIQDNARNRSFEASKDLLMKDPITSSLLELQTKYCKEFLDKLEEIDEKEIIQDLLIFD